MRNSLQRAARAVARLLQRFPRLTRREKTALAILFIPIVVGGYLASTDSPSKVKVVVDTLDPDKPLKVFDEAGAGVSQLSGRTKILSLDEVSIPDSEWSSEPHEVEVILHVSEAACTRLRSTFGGACGDPAPTQPHSELTLEWSGSGKAMVESSEAHFASLEQSPHAGGTTLGTRTLQLGAAYTVVEFPCPENRPFRLVHAGRISQEQCDFGGTTHHLNLRLPQNLLAKVFVSGLDHFHFKASGTRAEFSAEHGDMFVGDRHHTLPSGPVILASGEKPVNARVDARESMTDPKIVVRTDSADSAEAAEDSKLGNGLESFEVIWLLVVGAAIGLVMGVFLERA